MSLVFLPPSKAGESRSCAGKCQKAAGDVSKGAAPGQSGFHALGSTFNIIKAWEGEIVKCFISKLIVALLFAHTASARPSYTFTEIARTGSEFINFGTAGFSIPPRLNDSGMVAFMGRRSGLSSSTPNGVFRGDGTASAVTMYKVGGGSGDYSTMATNLGGITNSGMVSFSGYVAGTSNQMETIGDGTTTHYYTLPFSGYDYYLTYDLANDGSVPIDLRKLGGSRTVSREDGINPGVPIVSEGGPYRAFGPADVNDNHVVTMVADSAADGDSAADLIISGSGGPISVLYNDAGPFKTFDNFIATNNQNHVAFLATRDDNSKAVYIGGGGAPALIADTAGPYSSLYALSLNNSDQCAFTAQPDVGEAGLFVGPNPLTDKVIASGDTLFGSTVTGLEFRNGLNNNGQITFIAQLNSSTLVVVRADPVPEPGAAALAGCAVMLLRRRRC